MSLVSYTDPAVDGAALDLTDLAPAWRGMDDRDYHTWLLDTAQDMMEAAEPVMEKAARDNDYYDGKQWTAEEAKKLKERGQAAITLNGIRDKIDYYQGLEKQQRTKPNALPRTPADEGEAQAATDSLRFVTDQNKFDRIRSEVFGDILKSGWGGYEATVVPAKAPRPGQPEYRVTIAQCPWDRMLWDPYSSKLDFSDAAALGMILWKDRDAAIRMYGDGADQVFDETCEADGQVSYHDKPERAWVVTNASRRRIRIVQIYHLNREDGEWDFCEFTKGGILQSGPSPWKDEDGARIHPYAWGTAYIDRDNNRYGVIRDMIDPQDERNKRRSKALHMFTTRQTYGSKGILGDMTTKDMRYQLTRGDGHIELRAGAKFGEEFGIIPTGDMAAGQMELLNQVEGVFQTMGPNAALQGKKSGSDSGRALLAQQQGGAVQIGTVTDTLKQMDFDAYNKMWLLIREWWTGEIWLRVTKDQGNLQWVGINKPKLMTGPDGQPVVNPMTGQPQPVIGPDGQPVLENTLAGLAVDIDIEDAPAGGSLADENFQQLIQLKQMDQKGEIPFSEIIAAAPNLRNKQGLVERTRQNEQPAPPNPLEQAAATAKVQGMQADANLKNAQADKTKAEVGTVQADAMHTAALTRKAVVDTHGSATGTVLDAMQAAQALQAPLVQTPPGYTVPA